MEAKVFVKINEYKDVIDTIGLIKEKLSSAKDTLANITELKRKEDNELASWNSKISEVEDKIENIDNALLEPESL
ncbi:MAG: hypothetical protein ABIC04_01655 [Nanoarchaeota archaeon]